MARRPRYFLKDQSHHVIVRGNNRMPIFTCEADHLFFLLSLEEVFQKHGIVTHAFVLMGNHVHLLVTAADPQSLPRAMKSLGCRYVHYFNRGHERTGTLWEGRYRSALVDTARYFFTCMRYIEWNPVRSHIVARPEDYRWSSYRANAMGSDIGVTLTPHQTYLALARTAAARQSAYRRLFRQPLAQEELQAIRHATDRTGVLSSGRHPAPAAGVGPGYDPNAMRGQVGSDPGTTPMD